MPDVDLLTVARWAKSNGPADVYNAACRLLASVYADALDALLPPRGAESHQDARTPQTPGASEGQEATGAQEGTGV